MSFFPSFLPSNNISSAEGTRIVYELRGGMGHPKNEQERGGVKKLKKTGCCLFLSDKARAK
jgi:hypothetical protein